MVKVINAHLFKEQIIALIGETMTHRDIDHSFVQTINASYTLMMTPLHPAPYFLLLPDLSGHSPRSVPTLYVTDSCRSLIACFNIFSVLCHALYLIVFLRP